VFICVYLWFHYDDSLYNLGAVRVGQVHPGTAVAGWCAGADVFDLVYHPRAARRRGGGREQVFGNYYGTHRGVLEQARERGLDLVLDIDVQGARQLKSKIPEAVTVFILAPSREILEQRLRARGEDSDAVIERRLRDAANEIRNYSVYDYVLINQELTQSDQTLAAIVGAERVRRNRMEEQIRPILETFEKNV